MTLLGHVFIHLAFHTRTAHLIHVCIVACVNEAKNQAQCLIKQLWQACGIRSRPLVQKVIGLVVSNSSQNQPDRLKEIYYHYR